MSASYPIFKSTSIPWLPEMPEHWELRRNKYLLKELNERSLRGEEDLLSVSQYTGVTLKKDRLENEGDLLTTASTLEGYKVVRKDDLVINIMLAWNGSLGISDYDGIASPAYCVYRFGRNINPKYYHYLFRTDFMKLYFRSVSSGVIESRLRMYTDDFYRLYSFLPPLPEQTAIANYLDAKTEQINRFIEKKEKLIALLKEQKQAVIDELLEDKEGKWERRKLKYSGRVKTGRTPSIEKSKTDFFENGKINWYTPVDFQDEFLLNDSERKLKSTAFECNEVELFPEDSIYLIGIGGTLGKVAISSSRSSANQQINVITLDRRIFNPKYVLYYLSSIRKHLYETADYTTLPILNQTKTKNIKIPCPYMEIQKESVKKIDEKLRSVNSTISSIVREIEKVKELKQSLISEVVTGKIKVA